MRSYLLTGVAVSGLFCAFPAVAQSAPSPANPSAVPSTVPAEAAPQDAAPVGEGDGLADIVVTAQRKEESLQRAPIAVTALGADTIRDAGVTTPQALTALVPALQVSSGGNYPLYYIRGVGNFSGNPLSDSAVAVNFDGVYIGRPTSTYGLFYDLERVEVLKGPQGTLYGRNATGGSVNVLPRKPRIGETSGEASIEIGNYDGVRFDGAANIPISDKAAARIATIAVRHDGYLSNGTSDQDDVGGRLSFLFEPTTDLTLNLSGDYYSQGGNGPGAVVIPNGVKDRLDVTSPQSVAFYATQPISIAGRTFPGLVNDSYQDNKYWGASANISWTPEWGSVTFIPAYRGASLDIRHNAAGFPITQREKDRQFTGELRIASNDTQPLRWLVGGYYFDENIKVPRFVPNLQYNVSFLDYETGTKSVAGFGRLTYEVTNGLRVTAAGRYTHEKKFLDGTNFGQNRLCIDLPAFAATQQAVIANNCPAAAPFPLQLLGPVAATTPFSPAFPFVGFNEIYGNTAILQTGSLIDTDDTLTTNKFTWRAGIDWQMTPRNLVYANYETGFKAGGFFFSADDGTYRPEELKALTVGTKNRFFSNRLQFNVEGFIWRYSDQQISFVGEDSQRNFTLPVRNVGRGNFKGVEVETEFLLTDTTLLKADVQYLDAVYKSFAYQVPNQGPPVTGCRTSGLNTPAVTIDCAGFRPPNAPKWTLNLAARQTVPFGNGSEIVFDARSHYQSKTLVGVNFLSQEMQKAYWLADGSITYNAPDKRFFVAAFVNNMFDNEVISAATLVGLSSFSVGQLNTPRTYGGRAGFRF